MNDPVVQTFRVVRITKETCVVTAPHEATDADIFQQAMREDEWANLSEETYVDVVDGTVG